MLDGGGRRSSITTKEANTRVVMPLNSSVTLQQAAQRMTRLATRDQPSPVEGDGTSRISQPSPTSRPSMDQTKVEEAGSPRQLESNRADPNPGANANREHITPSPDRDPETTSPGTGPKADDKSHKRKKSNGMVAFLTLKEPSSKALQEFADAEKEKAKQKGVKPSVSSQKLPNFVPKVNSKWDGLPESASRRSIDSRVGERKRPSFSSTVRRDATSPTQASSTDDKDHSPGRVQEEPRSPTSTVSETAGAQNGTARPMSPRAQGKAHQRTTANLHIHPALRDTGSPASPTKVLELTAFGPDPTSTAGQASSYDEERTTEPSASAEGLATPHSISYQPQNRSGVTKTSLESTRTAKTSAPINFSRPLPRPPAQSYT